jgi:hypothetical protein
MRFFSPILYSDRQVFKCQPTHSWEFYKECLSLLVFLRELGNERNYSSLAPE